MLIHTKMLTNPQLMYRYLYLDSMFILYTASNVKIYLDTITNSLYILYSMCTVCIQLMTGIQIPCTVYISSGHTRRSRRSWSMETRRNMTKLWGTKSILFHTIFLLQYIGVFSLLEYLFLINGIESVDSITTWADTPGRYKEVWWTKRNTKQLNFLSFDNQSKLNIIFDAVSRPNNTLFIVHNAYL